MPAPYSYDLRIKAIEAVKRGERKIDVCRMLGISRNSLDLWLKREKEMGNCRAVVKFQQGCGHKIRDWKRFREFVQQHGDLRQGQMAQLWGDKVTQQNISDALRKIGISRQKKTYGYQERDEIKRQEFQKRLKSKHPNQIVYVDEAGIDNREEYA